VEYAEEFDRDTADFHLMIDKIWEIHRRWEHIQNIYVDAANPEIWSALKREFNEPYNIQYIEDTKKECKKHNIRIENRMMVVPIPFSTEGANMLQHTKRLLEEPDEDSTSLIAIHKERFHKLVTALRTAVANEYKLDKEQTSYNDILDAFRLALIFYQRRK
jgi:hypothetical protein